MSDPWFASEQAARRVGLRRWAQSYLPTQREAGALLDAGHPIGPARGWAPDMRRAPDNLTRRGRSMIFGNVHRPEDFDSRWLGVGPSGGAMRKPDERVQRQVVGRGELDDGRPVVYSKRRRVQPMHLEIYGGERPFRFSSPVTQSLRRAQRGLQARINDPANRDSWDRYIAWDRY